MAKKSPIKDKEDMKTRGANAKKLLEDALKESGQDVGGFRLRDCEAGECDPEEIRLEQEKAEVIKI